MSNRYGTLILIATALLLSACSDATTNGPSAVQIIRPMNGALFTFSRVETDSTGQEIAATRRTVIDTVVSANESFLERDSVVHFASGDGEYRIYYHSNGDISIPWLLTNDTAETPRWLLLSTGEGNSTSLPPVTENDGVVLTTYRVSTQYVGVDSVVIDGKSIKGDRVRITQSTEDQAGGNKIVSREYLDLSFAPDPGCFIRWDYVFVDDGATIGGFRKVMTGR